MNGYKLKKLYVENFKLIEKREIDFSSLDLMILNGPNGYGKTTIYDSLELLFTKRISRVVDNDVEDNKNKHEDSLFAKDKTKPIIIKVELKKNESPSLFLAIRLAENLNSKKWENYQQFRLSNFQEDIEDAEELNNFDELLGLTIDKINLTKDFKNFYYIQQENNTQFFRQSEKKRIELLSKFFGTEDAEILKNDLSKKVKKIKEVKVSISEELKLKQDELKALEEQNVTTVNKDAKYISLSIDKSWNKEEFIPSSKEKLKEITNEISDIENLIKYFDIFAQNIKNEEFLSIKKSKHDLKRLIVFANFIDRYDDIKELYEKETKYRIVKKIIEEQNYENLKKENLEQLFKAFNIDEDEKKVEDIKSTINTINGYIKESGEMSDISRLINESRESLFNEYKKFDDETKKKGVCPLCGYDKWESFDRLEKEFDEKKNFFEEFKDEKTKLAKDIKENLFKVKLKEINEQINKYLNTKDNIIDKGFYLQLKEYYDKSLYEVFYQKIKKLKLDKELLVFTNNEYVEVKDFDINLENIVKKIDSKVIEITNPEFHEKKESIISGFKAYNKSINEIKELDLSSKKIKQKKEWLDFKYYSNEEKKKEDINKVIDILSDKKELLEKLMSKVTKGIAKDLEDKLDKKIKSQWKNVIKQIEIPLYIYSGKILQDTQRGNGIFIDYDTTKKGSPLKFLSTLESDYDATYSMSTGQLSALVVALTLSLNKVYGKSDDGGLLLIDDPMQSMDEMNITSFIELIRNDFENTQFILSTHESKISRLLHYKYLKYNKEVKPYSVKDEFFKEIN